MRRVFVMMVLAAGVVFGYGSAIHQWSGGAGWGMSCPHAGGQAAPEAAP